MPMLKAVLIVFSVVLFLPNLFNKDINPRPPYNKIENFDPALAYINSVNKLEQHIDSIAAAQHIKTGSYDYVLLAESVTKDRFYHGFSHFTLNENWIAAVSGRMFEEGLACKVKQEDIICNSNAACSQQSIILMGLLRNKKITYRKVGFPHHYALEVLIDNMWYFFDADMEPKITKEQRMESSWKLQPDALKQYYDPRRYSDLDYKFGVGLTATTGTINEIPARNARIFDAVTSVLSKILWCFPLLLLFFRPSFSFSPKVSFRLKRKTTPFSLAT